jgi:hypothetical protein
MSRKGGNKMADREKIVRAVETCFDSWIDKHRNMGLDLYKVEQMKQDALELLKEQEAVKPRECQYPHDTYACGFCDYIPIGNKDGYRANYCPECGRAVKWDADGA